MQKSKTLSHFKLALSLLLLVFLPRVEIFLVLFLLHYLEEKRRVLLFVLFSLVLGFHLHITPSFTKIGVVAKVDENFILLQKPFYQIHLKTDVAFDVGDVISYEANLRDLKKEKDIAKLRKNILFEGELKDGVLLRKNNSLRLKIQERMEEFDSEVSSKMKKFLLYQTDYEELEDVFQSAGFSFLYVLRYFRKRGRNLKCISILIGIALSYGIIFGFATAIVYLLLSLLATLLFEEPMDRFSFLVFFLVLWNPYYIHSYTFLFPLLIQLFFLFHLKLHPFVFMVFLQSLFFQEISLLRSFFYRFYCLLMISLFVTSLLTLLFPFFVPLYLSYTNLIEFILRAGDFKLKGEMTLFLFLFFCVLASLFSWKKCVQSILVLSLFLFHFNAPFLSVVYIDVGQGDAILIYDSFLRNTILIDTGSSYQYHKLKKRLNAIGVTQIDCLIVTHDDEDHSGNLEALQKDYRVKEIIREPKDVKVGPFYLSSLNKGGWEDENADSLVYYMELNGTRFLFTGDINQTVEQRLIHELSPFTIDVLKLAHHGSGTSSSLSFLQEIDPLIAIASTSGQYHHPHKDVIKRLNDLDIILYSTKEKGYIAYRFLPLFHFIETEVGEFVIIGER